MSEASETLVASAQQALRQGKSEEAERLCKQVLVRDPHSTIANMILGNIAARGGDLRKAEPFFRRAAASEPQAYEPKEWVAIVLRETGRLDDAASASQELIRMRPNAPGPYMALGLCYLKMGRPGEAVPLFSKAAELDPKSALYRRNLGVALQSAGRVEEALSEFKLARSLAPNSAQSYLPIAAIYSERNQHEKAVSLLEQAVRVEPSSLALAQLALALAEVGRHEEADRVTAMALEANPKSVDALESIGIRLLHVGRFEEAEATLKAAIGTEQERAGPYFDITRTRKATESDGPFIRRMEEMTAQPGRPEEDLRKLHYAIAKSYDDLGEYEEAFEHYRRANLLAKHVQLRDRPYKAEAANFYVGKLISAFSTDLFSSKKGLGSDSEMPVLIVGMIRSGTTLVEQIVSSHSDVAGAGELHFWLQDSAGEATAAIVEGRSDPEQLNQLADDYLALLKAHANGKRRVTDKMPLNYHSVGLVHLLFPNARFIHCRRDPADTCASIYTTPFTGAPDFFYDIDNIVDGYRNYGRLMRHWRETLPKDRFYEVSYEQLVKEPEAVLPGLFEFLGLPWDESVLHHEANPRAINTPSSWQARQPLYGSSVGRWKRYEPWLGKFSELRNPGD